MQGGLPRTFYRDGRVPVEEDGVGELYNRYVRRCPFCRSANTSWEKCGALNCVECAARIPGGRERPGIWENDPRLEGAWDDYSRPGRLAGWTERADRELDLAARDNLTRIQALAAAVRALRSLIQRRPRTASKLPRRLLGWVRCCGLVWDTILRWVGLQLENARLRRGGLYEEVVEPSAPRGTPFGGYRHAIAVAFGGEGARELGAGALALGGAMSRFALPRGVVFGRLAVSPSRSSTGRAPGEGRLLDALDVWDAIRAARVGRRLDARGRLVDPGRPLSAAELEFLRLVDHGATRPRAFRQNKSIVPAIEPLSPRDALERLRARHGAALPETEREAHLQLRRARRAVCEMLVERGLIPAQRRRSAPASAPPPEAAPRSYGPIEPFRMPALGAM